MQDNDFIIEGYLINNPKRIKQVLDKYIVGHEDTKKTISQTVFNHIQILRGKETFSEQHTFLIGPSGCGKTEIFKILKEKSNIPIHILDMLTIINESSAMNYLNKMLSQIKNGDIVVIDDFELILYDENIYDIQYKLLKFIKGYNAFEIETKENIIRKKTFNKCLFIGISTFDNFFYEEKQIGFNTNKQEKKPKNKLEILKTKGMMNEILAEMTYIEILNKLNKSEYEKLIKNPYYLYNQLKQKFIKEHRLEVIITDEVFINIINNIDSELGVRNLNSEITKYFNDTLYNLDKSKKYNTVYITMDGSKYFKENKRNKR